MNAFGVCVIVLLTITCILHADAVILRSDDAGATWSQENSYCDEHLNDVSGVLWTADIAIAVGDNGTILRRDVSCTWTDVSYPGITDDLKSVIFTFNNTFWVAGENGRILYSVDLGLTWQLGTQAPIDINCLWKNPNVPNDPLYICGSYGQLYELIGSYWILINTECTDNLYAFSGNICQNSPNYVLGDGGICYNFSTEQSFVLGTTHFRGATRLAWGSCPQVAVGSRGGIYRSDYGESWTEVNSGTSTNLFDVALTSAVSPESYCAVGANGTVLRSTDGGHSWNAVYSGTGRILTGISEYSPTYRAYIVGKTDTSVGVGFDNGLPERTSCAVAPMLSGTLRIQTEANAQISAVLFDLMGRTVDQQSAHTVSGDAIMINFNAPRGFYLYSLSIDGDVITGKLVISE